MELIETDVKPAVYVVFDTETTGVMDFKRPADDPDFMGLHTARTQRALIRRCLFGVLCFHPRSLTDQRTVFIQKVPHTCTYEDYNSYCFHSAFMGCCGSVGCCIPNRVQ